MCNLCQPNFGEKNYNKSRRTLRCDLTIANHILEIYEMWNVRNIGDVRDDLENVVNVGDVGDMG